MSQEHALNGWDLLDSGDSESAQTIVSYSLSSNGWSWWFLTTGMPFLVAGGWNIAKGRRHRALVSFAFLVVWALLAFVAHWSGLNQGA